VEQVETQIGRIQMAKRTEERRESEEKEDKAA
jgi:hypothetical protein